MFLHTFIEFDYSFDARVIDVVFVAGKSAFALAIFLILCDERGSRYVQIESMCNY